MASCKSRSGTTAIMYGFSWLLKNDYFLLTKFLVPLAFTEIAVDIGDQFLTRSIARTTDVVNTLAAFGLAYVLVRFFVGVLQEMKQAGLVLVQDRPGFYKILLFATVEGTLVSLLVVVIAKTHLGVWLVEDLHGVTPKLARLTHSGLLYLSAYPLFECIFSYHAGILLRWRYSTLVGSASMADLVVKIFSVAILLYTPLVCTEPIVVPILAAYGGVITRCTIILVGFYWKIYPKLHKEKKSNVTALKFTGFLAPLMLVVGVQKISRPMINLLVARFSLSKCEAAEAIAVLTASYPLGHLLYGWLNHLRALSPAFERESPDGSKPVVQGKKIRNFALACLLTGALVAIITFWTPGVSESILEHAVGIPHELAILCVYPLRVLSFACLTVVVRASLTGWLTLHRQTKLVAPSAFVRVAAILAALFLLAKVLQLTGALMGVVALLFGLLAETVMVVICASTYAFWKYRKCRKGSLEEETESDLLSESERSESGREDFGGYSAASTWSRATYDSLMFSSESLGKANSVEAILDYCIVNTS